MTLRTAGMYAAEHHMNEDILKGIEEEIRRRSKYQIIGFDYDERRRKFIVTANVVTFAFAGAMTVELRQLQGANPEYYGLLARDNIHYAIADKRIEIAATNKRTPITERARERERQRSLTCQKNMERKQAEHG
jgi:hypothetical protein